MAYDDVLTRNEDQELAVRVVSATESATVVNPNDVYTRDTDGNLAIRTVGNGGGGGSDPHNLGWYATPEALRTAHPTADDGDWAIVGSTDTVWVWDSDTNAWKDSDQKGQVTSVNGQTGDVTVQATLVNQSNIKSINGNSLLGSGNLDIDGLPSQTGNAGKFLITNGTSASWGNEATSFKTKTQSSQYYVELKTGGLFNNIGSLVFSNGSTIYEYLFDSTGFKANFLYGTDINLGSSSVKWTRIYVNKINNGNDINVPTVAGSMSVQVSSMPTADSSSEGQIYQFTGTTDSTYTNGRFYKCVSDGQPTPTYSWEEVSMGGGSSLPSQTGNAGKFLKTNGTDASWGSAVENITTGQRSFIVGGDNTNSVDDFISIGYSIPSTMPSIGGTQCVQIGGYAKTSNVGGTSIGYSSTATGVYSTALGNNCNAGTGTHNVAIGAKVSISNSCCVAVGANAIASSSSVAIGGGAKNTTSAQATDNSIAIGYNAHATATKAIQLGEGSNSTANTFKVANTSGNFELMSANGTIPADRLVNAINKYSTIPTAGADNLGWIVQFTGTTDSTYTHGHLYECVSDGADPATYSWTEVQLGGGGSSYTAGTGIDITSGVISVASPTLTNTATGSNSLTVLGTATSTNQNSINIGKGSSINNQGAYDKKATVIGVNSSGDQDTVVIGYGTTGGLSSVVIGSSASGNTNNVIIGYNASGSTNLITCIGKGASCSGLAATAIGQGSHANAQEAIQIGVGTNSTANTLSIGLGSSNNYRLLNSDGTIPKERLVNAVSKPSTMPTLAVADWSNNTQTVTVTGVTATNIVFVSPAPASASDYASAGIICTAQGTDSLTFTCTTVPSNDITVNVVIMG